jgi:hypothetical protein
VDTSGNVGVGVVPAAAVAGNTKLQITGSNNSAVVLGTNSANASARNWAVIANWNAFGDLVFQQSNALGGDPIASGAGTSRMTLDANGQLLLGTTSTSGAVDIGMVMNKPSASGFVGNVYRLNDVDKAYTYIASAASALRIDTVAGYTVNVVSSTNGVYLANGGTSWLALSDERFKDIIEPISNAVAKVGSLRSVIGKFKSEAEGTRRPFLLAQDVQAVFPEAVDATKPEQLGLSYTEVVPLLVAAIKELTARVQTLEAR